MRKLLTKIDIKNYQSIYDASLKLGSITVFVGKSNSGKSALFRALKALSYNQSGSDFISHGTTQTTVKLSVEDKTLTWKKGTETYYDLNGTKYSKTGTSVPYEIQSILKLPDIELDDNLKISPNFSGQFDSVFMLSESKGYISKIFGKLMNVNELYNAVNNCAKDLKRVNSDIKSLVEQSQDLEDKTKNYPKIKEEYLYWVNMNTQSEAIKESIVLINKLQKKQTDLETSTNQYEITRKELKCINNSVFVEYGDITKHITNLNHLKTMKKTLDKDTENLEKNKLELVSVSKELKNITAKLSAVKIQEQIVKDLLEKREKLLTLNSKLVTNTNAILLIEEEKSKYIELINVAKEKLKTFNVCPLCGTHLGEHHV